MGIREIFSQGCYKVPVGFSDLCQMILKRNGIFLPKYHLPDIRGIWDGGSDVSVDCIHSGYLLEYPGNRIGVMDEKSCCQKHESEHSAE